MEYLTVFAIIITIGAAVLSYLIGKGIVSPIERHVVPATISLSASDTGPLAGYGLVGNLELPSGLEPGPVFPGGMRARVVLQAHDLNQVVQVDRVSLLLHIVSPQQRFAFDYTVDSSKQGQLGAARPRVFQVILNRKDTPLIRYLQDSTSHKDVTPENILTGSFQILTLDGHDGLQENLDFFVRPDEPGIYQLRFSAHFISGGRDYDAKTPPVYIVRK